MYSLQSHTCVLTYIPSDGGGIRVRDLSVLTELVYTVTFGFGMPDWEKHEGDSKLALQDATRHTQDTAAYSQNKDSYERTQWRYVALEVVTYTLRTIMWMSYAWKQWKQVHRKGHYTMIHCTMLTAYQVLLCRQGELRPMYVLYVLCSL